MTESSKLIKQIKFNDCLCQMENRVVNLLTAYNKIKSDHLRPLWCKNGKIHAILGFVSLIVVSFFVWKATVDIDSGINQVNQNTANMVAASATSR